MATRDAPTTTPTFPAGAFRRIGWAFLFLGISIGPSIRQGDESFLIDVLPDFIGYLMIATAANRLVPLHPRARGVRNLALLLTYLTIPTIIQYTVVTSKSETITIWLAPLWPLLILQALLQMVLVWMLCGLVADLARRAGDAATEKRARVRRVLVIFLQILVNGGLGFVLLSPSRALIAGAILALAIGLALIAMMMDLMWRAERMCKGCPEVAAPPAEMVDKLRSGGWIFRLLALGGILLPIGLVLGAFGYYQEWYWPRQEEKMRSNYPGYDAVRAAFYAHLLAGRIDDAYESTSADFKRRINRDRFAQLAQQYVIVRKKPPRGGGFSGGFDIAAYSTRTDREYFVAEKGKIVVVTIMIGRDRDSILFLKLPPLKVQEFKVEEKAEAK
jgi:hypothetical protein